MTSIKQGHDEFAFTTVQLRSEGPEETVVPTMWMATLTLQKWAKVQQEVQAAVVQMKGVPLTDKVM